jgi:hypothetical protein
MATGVRDDVGYEYTCFMRGGEDERLHGRFSSKGYHRSSKAARGEDLQVEHPVCSGYASAFHLYPTLPGMLRAPLIRDQVIQVRQPREKRLLTLLGEALTGEGEL